MKYSSRKKIVLMIPQLRHGGAERVVSRLSSLLKDEYDLNIVIFDQTEITYEISSKVFSIDVKPNNQNKVFGKLVNVFKRVYRYSKYKKENNIDITYSFGDTANLVNVFSRGHDKKLISIRGFKRVRNGENMLDKFFLKPISKLISKRADLIISVSSVITEELAKQYKLDQSKIITIHNGYDFENITNLSTKEIGEYGKYIDKDKYIVTAGTFRSEKGYWHLLKAFSIVVKSYDTVKLVILGSDYNHNRVKVEKLAKELNIEDKIIITGYESNPYKYFKNSLIYVLSSTSEGFPNSLVEAMSLGVPVIASDCKSGPREIIAPDTLIQEVAKDVELAKYGVLVKPMSSKENWDKNDFEECDEALSEAILMLLNSEELREKYKERSIIRSRDFNYNNWKNKHVTTFNKILKMNGE